MINTKEFKDRREKLYKELDDNSVLILYAGRAKKRSADENYTFYGNRNFYYLTNIEQEDSILFVTKSDGIITEYLFIQECDENKEKWTGIRLRPEEASKLSGISNVLFINTFNAQLAMTLNKNEHIYGIFNNIYLDLEKEQKIDAQFTTEMLKNSLSANYDYLKFIDVYPIIIKLRKNKSSEEVEELKEAVHKTNLGLNKILKALNPGLYEYQLSSLFYYTIQDFDHSELSFPTICASGKNAVILHYPNAKDKMQSGDLVLLDLGCKHNGYCADITRTYPVNGKFSDMQKLIYSIVLEANKMVIKTVRPGLTLVDLQEKTKEFLARKCLEANLIKSLDDINNIYYHTVSHHIGLDTHDPIDKKEVLVPGNIISDEPGLYFKELGIGVRIEDDLLITEDGCYCLSGNIIKEIADIERAMLFREQ